MNNRLKALAVVGGIAIVTTIVVCLLSIDNWSGTTIPAFIFLLWAEIAFFGCGILVERISGKGDAIITRSSWYIIGSIYSCIVFTLSLLNLGNHNAPSKWFWVIQILLFAVALIFLFVFSSVSKGVHRNNDQTTKVITSFSNNVSRLALLSEKVNDNDQSALLKKLSEEFRFTDSTAVVEADTKIERAISSIELEVEKNSPDQSVISICISEINSAIKERKIQTSISKRGSI